MAADSGGHGVVVENEWGAIGRIEFGYPDKPSSALDLKSEFVRTKYLNAYYDYELDTLTN